MNNSEIISILLKKNPAKKTSGIRKVQILQAAAKYGTATDIRKVYDQYKNVEFSSGALAYAFERGDMDKLCALLDNNARFCSDELKNDFKNKYIDNEWNYRFSVIPEHKTYYSANNKDLAIQFTGENFTEVEYEPCELLHQVKLFVEYYSKDRRPYWDSSAPRFLVTALRQGYNEFVKACLLEGFTYSEYAIKEANSIEFQLLHRLSVLPEEKRYESLSMLCDAAESVEMKLMPEGTMQFFGDAYFVPRIFDLIIGRCDLKRYSKKELIEMTIDRESEELLSILKLYGFFDTAKARKSAVDYAKSENREALLSWMEREFKRLVCEQKKEAAKAIKPADSDNAKWFTHKGNTITGFSKTGIKTITSSYISSVRLPEVMDGTHITLIGKDFTKKFRDQVQNLHTLIIPDGIVFEDTVSSYSYIEALPDANTGIHKLIFETDKGFSIGCIGNGISEVEILDGTDYMTQDGVVFSKDGQKLLLFPRNRHVSTYTIPEHVKEICTGAFERCFVDELIIPNSVKVLGYRFACMCHMKRLSIGSGVSEIPSEGCSDCDNMTELKINEGLKVIGEGAFTFCNAKKVVFPKSLKRIDRDAFADSTSKFSFLSDDVLIGPHAFVGCDSDMEGLTEKLKGKMMRCGFYKYDEYDNFGDYTRDQAIEDLNRIMGFEVSVPETVLFLDLYDLVSRYKLYKSDRLLNEESVKKEIENRIKNNWRKKK